MRTRKVNPPARRAALAIGVGRISLGVATILATRPALEALGFSDPDRPVRTLGRLVGGRDFALGALTIAARDDRRALCAAVLVGAGADLVDALALGHTAFQEETTSAGIALGAIAGATASVAGAWTARRL